MGAALRLLGSSQGTAAPLPPPPRFKDLKALSKGSALSPKGRHPRCVCGPPGCPSPEPPPQAPAHLWLCPALRAQARGWGQGEEVSRGLTAQRADPSRQFSAPHPSQTQLGVGAGVLADPADRGGVPALTCPAVVAGGGRLSRGHAGVLARRFGARAGDAATASARAAAAAQQGLIHQRRRETAQPGRRAAVFLLVRPRRRPAPPPPPRPAPRLQGVAPRPDPGGCWGRAGGKQMGAPC